MKINSITITTAILTLIGCLLIALKLTNHIDWPWWLVFLPIYLPWVIGFIFAGILVLLIVIYGIG